MYISDKLLSYIILFLGLVITVLLLELLKSFDSKTESFTDHSIFLIENQTDDDNCDIFYELEDEIIDVAKIKSQRFECFMIIWDRLLPVVKRIIIKSLGLSNALNNKIDVYQNLESVFESLNKPTIEKCSKYLYNYFKQQFFDKNSQLLIAINEEWIGMCRTLCITKIIKQLCEGNSLSVKFCESVNQTLNLPRITNDLLGSDVLEAILFKTGITQSSPINQDFVNLGIDFNINDN